MIRDFRSVWVAPTDLLREVIRVMDAAAMAIALVVDGQGRLLGTVTDGDVRRGMLRGLRLEDPVERVMHRTPITARPDSPREDLLLLMRQRQIEHLPLVDQLDRVVGLVLLDDLIGRPREKGNRVILLAGGLGSRLRPLTEVTPKPLLEIGDHRVLPLLIDQIAGYGFREFLVAVNHQAELLERQLGNGEEAGVRIRYLREPIPLGTVGAVRMAQQELDRPFLVVNGDLLTKINFEHLLEFHLSQPFDLTLAIKEYPVQIPYGVVELTEGQVVHFKEKPSQSYFVNAGIYALNPSVIPLIPDSGRYDMTDLIQAALLRGMKVGGFPIHEYWLDIGQPQDYRQARKDVSDGLLKEWAR